MRSFYRVQHKETKIGPYNHPNPMQGHEVMQDTGKRLSMGILLLEDNVSLLESFRFLCGFESIKDLRRWFPPEVLLPLVRDYGFEIVRVRGALVAKADRGYNSVVFRPEES